MIQKLIIFIKILIIYFYILYPSNFEFYVHAALDGKRSLPNGQRRRLAGRLPLQIKRPQCN